MTVVDFLKQSVDMLAKDIRSRAEASVARLRSAYDDEERILQDALNSKLAQDEDAAKKCELHVDVLTTKHRMQECTYAQILSIASNLFTESKAKMSLHLMVETGPYKGQTFIIKPRARRRVARLGRSTGSDYTRHGVSLADDPEVSTYHGKFESSGGNVYFTDVGSTNGSILNGTDLVANDRMHLRTGDLLRVGATDMRVRVDSEADGAASKSTGSSAATRSTVRNQRGRRGASGSTEEEGAAAGGGGAERGAEDEDEEEEEEEEEDAKQSRSRRAGGRGKVKGKGGAKEAGGGKRRTRRG